MATRKQKKAKLAVAAIAAVVALGGPASAGKKVNYEADKSAIFTPVFGKALPPVGYVNFCARNTRDCRNLGGTAKTIKLTTENWKILHEVNAYSNRSIKPVTDIDLYNVPEHWTYPTNAGDCEDYVLQKKRYLEGLGFPAETLLITVVLDEMGLGHAVLTVRTDRGDFVLDNMKPQIKRWDKTGYVFIKRQSQKNPQVWVSLTKRGLPVRHTTVAGGN